MVVVVVKKYGKKMGYSSVTILMFICCLAAVCLSVTSQQGKSGMRISYRLTSSIMKAILNALATYNMLYANTGVILLWQGVQYPNNSILNIEAIGEDEHALVCQTDRRYCCRFPYDRIGEWYYPNGSAVPIQNAGAPFYRNRDEGIVRLNQRNHSATSYSIGSFCCVLPDASDRSHTLCIGLLPIGSTGGTLNLLKLHHE